MPAPVIVLAAIMVLMSAVWLLSVIKKDASIVDIVWGPGFAMSAWLYFVVTEDPSPRKWIICIATSIWGLRLGVHIFLRSLGKGEDYRYAEMREARGDAFWWQSFFTIFVLQGILIWLIGLCLYAAQKQGSPDTLVWSDGLALGMFIIGFVFEAVGDYQLHAFKSDPKNKGKVMNQGLWRYTRHPNYFGDALLWWGLFLFALPVPGGLHFIFSPIIMSFLLMRVSGVTLLEKKLSKSREGYDEYARQTNAFFPWFPKKR